MARTIRNSKIDTRSARAGLPQRREPYWTVLGKGCAIGYRKGATGGTWVARMRDEAGRQHYHSIGAADDGRDPDGLTAFSFPQAQRLADAWFREQARVLSGEIIDDGQPYTVARAISDYFAERLRAGASKGLEKDVSKARLNILPALGEVLVSKLTTRRLREWQGDLVTTGRNVGAGGDALRKKKATANRVFTILRAALNHAFREGRVASDDAWRRVAPYREADAPVIKYLSDDEARRLVNACDGAFRDLVRAALLTGCRYGELCRAHVADFNSQANTLAVRQSKSGKPRHVALSDEGRAFFDGLTAGRPSKSLVFMRDDGEPWGPSHQQRPLDVAAARAGLEGVSFHVLRHTYASALVMRGVPLGVIAAQLGHADTRVTERHYAHLAPGYVSETVRAALPSLGIVEVANIAPMRRQKSGGRSA